MGIILTPIFIAIFFATYKSVKIGWNGVKSETGAVKVNLIVAFGLAFVICAIPILGYLLYLSGNEIYSFELLIYIHAIPLLVLVILANLIPKSTDILHFARNVLFLSTIFLFPLAFIAYEFLLPWFNISTTI